MKLYKLLLSLFLCLAFVQVKAQNPFEEFGYKPKIATLSKGKYIEFIKNDTIVQVGNILYNTITDKFVGFVEKDTLNFPAGVASRWWSIDPLAEEYYNWSPYNYVLDNPINAIDPDGTNVYIINENGTWTLAKLTDSDHEFYYKKGDEVTKLDHMGKDRMFVASYLADNEDMMNNMREGLSGEYKGSKGNTMDDFQKSIGIYNSQQLKNSFNDIVTFVIGGFGIYRAIAGYFGAKKTLQQMTRGELSSMIKEEQRSLVNKFFKENVKMNKVKSPSGKTVTSKAEMQGEFKIPEGLTKETLKVYREIAVKTIKEKGDPVNSQAERIKLIDAALKKMK